MSPKELTICPPKKITIVKISITYVNNYNKIHDKSPIELGVKNVNGGNVPTSSDLKTSKSGGNETKTIDYKFLFRINP